MVRMALGFTLIVLLAGCDRSKIDEAKWKEAGAEAVLPLKKNLTQALVAGLEKGPAEAISVCRLEAPRLADAASRGGAKVGRSSRKLRNPANAPKAWMEPFLELYETDPDRREPGVVLIDEHTVGYVEPIFMQPLCVTCHGAELAPEVRAKLEGLYPADQATGYSAGDLRGIFWAELPRE
ncbi:MAG: DUF3365 domain-containing protein [Polyangiales bacterium]